MPQFKSFYRHCGQEWSDVWSSACNDECPKCRGEIEPYEYIELKADGTSDEAEPEPGENLCECDNCGHTAPYDDLPPAKRLSLRLEIGGTYTDVECPHCGALCYPVKKNEDVPTEAVNADPGDEHVDPPVVETLDTTERAVVALLRSDDHPSADLVEALLRGQLWCVGHTHKHGSDVFAVISEQMPTAKVLNAHDGARFEIDNNVEFIDDVDRIDPGTVIRL